MNTLGELAQALSRMDILSRRLDDAHTRLSTLMLPDRRQPLLQQEQQWQEEYDQLYNTPLWDQPTDEEASTSVSATIDKPAAAAIIEP